MSAVPAAEERLITSQIDTAPKQDLHHVLVAGGLITSQIDTAPKQRGRRTAHHAV